MKAENDLKMSSFLIFKRNLILLRLVFPIILTDCFQRINRVVEGIPFMVALVY